MRGRSRLIEFHYTAPTFRTPERVRFRYRLEGLHHDWVDAGTERVARYTNLRLGSYRFRVSAANNFGLWNEAGADLAFSVVVPFHETWWFWPACGAALSGLLAWGGWWRHRQLDQLRALNQERRLAQQRDRLARDIHDDLGAGLTRLALLSERVVRESHDSDVQAFAGRLAGEASRLIDNLGKLVWATDTKHDRLPDLLAFLREHAAVFLDDAGLLARLEFPASVPDIQVGGLLRRTVHFALKEALTNAVRHGGASQIAVTARISDSGLDLGETTGPPTLEITVADDGRGFGPPGVEPRPDPTTIAPGPTAATNQRNAAAQSSPHAASAPVGLRRGGGEGRGLPGLRARFAECGRSLEIRTTTGHGTTLILRVPLKPRPPHGTA